MTSEQPRVAIIVLNWNGVAYLQACFDALLAQDCPDLQIVLVDNDSADNSVQFTREQFPQIEIIVNERNLGFAAGNNRALQTIQADVYVLVNPDVVVSAEWLPQLLATLDSDPSIGIAGGKLHYPDGNLIQFGGGEIMLPRAESTHFGMREADRGQCDIAGDVGYVIGAAMAIRRDVLKQVGLFDEGYFLYYEDADYCERARYAGFRVVYAPQATAVHHESAVASLHSPFYWQHFHRGRLRYALKHFSSDVLTDAFRQAEAAWLAVVEGNQRLGVTLAYRAIRMDLDTIWHARSEATHDFVVQQSVAGMLDDFWHSLLAGEVITLQPEVREVGFESSVPVFGRFITAFRTAWNNVAARWTVHKVVQQQNSFNADVVALLDQRIRREADLLALSEQQDNEISALRRELAELRAELARLRLEQHD